MLTFFSFFFLPRIWKITSELPVRSPTQMRINQDMAKGKFTLNSNFKFSFSYLCNSWHSFMNNQNLRLTLTIVSVYAYLCKWPHRQLWSSLSNPWKEKVNIGKIISKTTNFEKLLFWKDFFSNVSFSVFLLGFERLLQSCRWCPLHKCA